MLQLRMGEDRPAPQPDPLGRSRIGWRAGMSEAEAWAAGRGVWKLNPGNVLAQDEAQVISPDGIVRAVASITGVSRHGDREAVEGRVLAGDPRVGQPSPYPHRSRNAVVYGRTDQIEGEGPARVSPPAGQVRP